jgi:hypothetical protein
MNSSSDLIAIGGPYEATRRLTDTFNGKHNREVCAGAE